MPMYEGGFEAMMRFISQKIKYPNSARQMGIEGTAFVQFVVNSEGKVTDVAIVRGFNAACDAEAARVIALMKNWKAGQQNNTAVSVRMVLPIKFKINDN
jgi:protein TonB